MKAENAEVIVQPLRSLLMKLADTRNRVDEPRLTGDGCRPCL